MTDLILSAIEAGRTDAALQMIHSTARSGLLHAADVRDYITQLAMRQRFDLARAVAKIAAKLGEPFLAGAYQGLFQSGMIVDAARVQVLRVKAAPMDMSLRIILAKTLSKWDIDGNFAAAARPLISYVQWHRWEPSLVSTLLNWALRRADDGTIDALRPGIRPQSYDAWVLRLYDHARTEIDAIPEPPHHRPAPDAPARPSDTPETILHLVTWGQDYITLFLDMVVPALLAPGNIPTFCRHRSVRLIIDTRDGADAERLTAHFASHPIRRYLEVEVIGNAAWIFDYTSPKEDGRWSRAPLDIWSAMVQMACHRARARQADIVFLFSDVMMADGSLSHLHDLMTGGAWEACALQHCGATLSTARPHLDACRREDGSLVISPDHLVDITVQHLSARYRSLVVREQSLTVPNLAGMLVEAIPHGLRVTYTQTTPLFLTQAGLAFVHGIHLMPIDDGFIDALFARGLDPQRVHFLTSFKSYGAVSLERETEPDHGDGSMTASSEAAWVATLIKSFCLASLCTPVRMLAMTHPITFQGTGAVTPDLPASEVVTQRLMAVRHQFAALLKDQVHRVSPQSRSTETAHRSGVPS